MLATALDEMLIGPTGDPHAFLNAAASRFRDPAVGDADTLSFGLDLGTATVVLTAVDAAGRPVYWDAVQCQAIHDGVVVNFAEAVASVRKLKADAERVLACKIFDAATAHPPGVPQADCRACRYVLEQAEINCRALVDEVSAAQALLGLEDGAIADVGGGSTGVGVFEGGRLVTLSDRPGGGHYLDLILAGAQRIPIEEAERRKRMAPADYVAVLRPGLERIASSIKEQLGKASVASIHLVGGAIRLPEAGAIIARVTGVPTKTYPHADLVTPFGIAVS
ncbi:MAG: ethanolamine utilization protein EutJ [Roseiarcus sp.]|jgi:ethanolamine utilization protein EutJ